MFKALILLTRREDMTHAAFVDWWLEDHSPLAATLPRLRKLVFSVVDGAGDPGIDGVSELWFDSREDFDAAYATAIGRAVAADTLVHVGKRVRLLVIEHPLVEPSPA